MKYISIGLLTLMACSAVVGERRWSSSPSAQPVWEWNLTPVPSDHQAEVDRILKRSGVGYAYWSSDHTTLQAACTERQAIELKKLIQADAQVHGYTQELSQGIVKLVSNPRSRDL